MIEKIIQESLHSYQYGTLSPNELEAIMKIVDHAKRDLDKNNGNRSKVSKDSEVHVLISFEDVQV